MRHIAASAVERPADAAWKLQKSDMMNNTAVFIVLAVATGLMIPVQAALNTGLNKHAASPVLTTLLFLAVAITTTLLVWIFSKPSLPKGMFQTPGYMYLGGIILTVYALLIPVITPKVGVGASIGLVITGQLIGAIVIDHFGWLHMPVHQLNWIRILGAVLMVAGIYLVMGPGER